jgi:hypothetical protein
MGSVGAQEPVGGDTDGELQSSGRAPSAGEASGLSMVLKV